MHPSRMFEDVKYDPHSPLEEHNYHQPACNSTSIFFVEQHEMGDLQPQEPRLFDCTDKNSPEMYTCDKCGIQVYLKVNLQVHLAFAHGNETGMTLEDFFSFSQRKFNLSNILKCHKCEICFFQTHSLLVLMKHISKNHEKSNQLQPPPNKKPRTCAYCRFDCKYDYQLHKHLSLKHQKTVNVVKVVPKITQTFECEQCLFKSTNKYTMKAHIERKHTVFEESDLLKCDKCSYQTPHKDSFKHHSRRHVPVEERKWFQCKFCPHKAKQKHHLQIHVTAKHMADEEIKWFSCEHCEYKAKLKATLRGHVLSKHTSLENINWIQCTLCSYKCKRKSHLKQHSVRMHKEVT